VSERVSSNRKRIKKKKIISLYPQIVLYIVGIKEKCMEKKFIIERDELYKMYIVKNMSRRECAEYYGCSEVLIKKKVQDFNIRKNKHLESINKERKKALECEYCGEKFIVSRFRATNKKWKRKYCSHKCSSDARYLGEEHKRAILNSVAATRRANMKSAYDESSSQEKINEYYTEAKRLTTETGIPHEVDHIIPISKGGKHHENNLQILTINENRRKGNK